MIHVACVAQLMDHHVPQMLRVEEHQAVVETDGTGARVTAPTGPLTTDMHGFEGVARLCGQRP